MEWKNFRANIAKPFKLIGRNPIKASLVTTLLFASGLALKDDIHFGSVAFNNFGDNKYVFGINSQTKINGKLNKGNLYVFGLDSKIEFVEDAQLEGNLFSAGVGNGEISLGIESKIIGNTSAYGMALGSVLAKRGATITGDINTGGINAQTPYDIKHGLNSLLNLEDYTFD